MTTREKIAAIDRRIAEAYDAFGKNDDIPTFVTVEMYERQRKAGAKEAEDLIYEDSWARTQKNGRAFFLILIGSCRKSKRGGEEALYLLYREKEEEFRCLHALLKE